METEPNNPLTISSKQDEDSHGGTSENSSTRSLMTEALRVLNALFGQTNEEEMRYEEEIRYEDGAQELSHYMWMRTEQGASWSSTIPAGLDLREGRWRLDITIWLQTEDLSVRGKKKLMETRIWLKEPADLENYLSKKTLEKIKEFSKSKTKRDISLKECWYKQKTGRRSFEVFWPGKHLAYAQLEQDRLKDESGLSKLPFPALQGNYSRPYSCITDGERLKSLSGYNTNLDLPISTLRHLTTQGPAERILVEGGFRGGDKEISTLWPDQRYSWWSVHYDERSRFSKIAHERAGLIQGELKKYPHSCYNPRIVPSYPFLDKGVYDGNHAFTYNIHYMVNAYRDQFCGDQDLVLRILGTFVYFQQIMYAVLIHSSEYDCIFGHLPLVSKQRPGNRIYQSSSGEIFWCPESIIRREDEPYSPWERLCFAFHLPECDSVLKLDDPRGHYNFVECSLYKAQSAQSNLNPNPKMPLFTSSATVVQQSLGQ